MTDPQAKPQQPSSVKTSVDEEIDLFDYLLVVWRAKWWIAFLCIVAMAATVAISFTKPRYYQSSVTIVPPLESLRKDVGMGGLGSFGGSLLRDAMGGLGGSISGIYMEILESREVADSIIDRLRLMEIYENVRYSSDARRELRKNTKIESTKDGAVKVAVQDRDPNRAAVIAGAYIEELDKQNKRLSMGQATSKRVFLENGLKEVEARLSKIDNILSREAKTQEMLYEMLVQQYELAKIEEAESMPTIQVLDAPVVPEIGVARGTAQKGVLAGVAAFMLGVFLAFTREYVVQARCRRQDTGIPAARDPVAPRGDGESIASKHAHAKDPAVSARMPTAGG